MPRRILCVLAGGRSSRFGVSKLDVHINRRPILTWLLDRLGEWADEHWLSLAPGQAAPPGGAAFERVVTDQSPYAGPLAAMADAMRFTANDDHIAFVAADKPLLEAWYLAALERLIDPRCGSAMGVWMWGERRGKYEPMPVVFHAGRARPMLQEKLAAGLRGPYQLVGATPIALHPLGTPNDPRMLLNLNTPEDLAALRKACGLPPAAIVVRNTHP